MQEPSPERFDAALVRVGNWVEVKGAFNSRSEFVASSVVLIEEQEYEVLIGTTQSDSRGPSRLSILNAPISISEKTEWTNMDPVLENGMRYKVSGRYRGPSKFSARDIRPRPPGRDRVLGRVDRVASAGTELRWDIMHLRVVVPREVGVESDDDPGSYPLTTRRWKPAGLATRVDEDDLLRERFEVLPGLRLGGQLELTNNNEDEFDLDVSDPENRNDLNFVARVRLAYRVADNVFARVEGRFRQLWREDDEDGSIRDDQARLGEAWIYWRDFLGPGWDIQVGRQDFDDEREWIYDQNLDALRLTHVSAWSRIELAVATTLGAANRFDKGSLDASAYWSNLDDDRHLAAWAMHRNPRDVPGRNLTHAGVRAIGDWLPSQESWIDLAGVVGEESSRDVAGWAFDIGTVIQPEGWPIALSAGLAYGSGESDSTGSDGAFRQTGLEDNNGKLGTATSIRYYGELFDPELSNLQIGTLGVSWWLSERTTLALLAHNYRQVEAAPFLRDASIDADPNGIDTDLGWEFDLVLGSRSFDNMDIELIVGEFIPGSAFDANSDDSQFVKLQIRYRF